MENQLMHTNETGIRVEGAYQIEPSVFENNDLNDLHYKIKTEPPDEFETIGLQRAIWSYDEFMSEQHGLPSDMSEAHQSETMDTHVFDRIKIEPQDYDRSRHLGENGVVVKSEQVSDEEQLNSGDLAQPQDFRSYPRTIETTSDNLLMQGSPKTSDIEKMECGAGFSIGSNHYQVRSDELFLNGAVKSEPLEAEDDHNSLTAASAVRWDNVSTQHWKVKNERDTIAEHLDAPESAPRCQNTGAVSDKTVIFVNLDTLTSENTSNKPGAESHEAQIFICDECNQSFGSYRGLIQHQTSHVDDAGQKSYKVKLNLTIFRCQKCGGNFCDSHSLSQHVCNIEEQDSVFSGLYQESYLEDGRGIEHLTYLESGSMCECRICEKRFSSVEVLTRHRDAYGHNQCRKCCTLFSRMKFMGRHVSNAGKNLIRCCSCACLFERKEAVLCSSGLSDQALKFHNRLYDEEFVGSNVGQKCNQRSENVSNHVKCEKCNNVFKSYDSLRRHDEKAHPTARTYNCKYCAKEFERKDSLICHEGIHKGTNKAKSLPNVVTKDRKNRKMNIDDADFSPYRAQRGGKVDRGTLRGRGKPRNKTVTLCCNDSDTHEDKSQQNSAKGVYHVSRRTCMAVNDNGEYCTGKYKIDLADNERRCQKCGAKPN
ncbi:zinc finger protein 331-like [Lineus longissimus]|uniref:zinc finger protein 331-like n=1 Tax=Lineus longissimus TaxID=88925 RepID=UPI002B4CABAB